jgi:hypothetical protein
VGEVLLRDVSFFFGLDLSLLIIFSLHLFTYSQNALVSYAATSESHISLKPGMFLDISFPFLIAHCVTTPLPSAGLTIIVCGFIPRACMVRSAHCLCDSTGLFPARFVIF